MKLNIYINIQLNSINLKLNILIIDFNESSKTSYQYLCLRKLKIFNNQTEKK